MCKISNELKLCTCENLNLKIRKDKEVKYVKENEMDIMGMCALPVEELNKELSGEYIVKRLNEKNIFDFDYVPQEKDCLKIKTVERKNKKQRGYLFGEFMELIYTENKWTVGWGDPFGGIMKDVAEGVVEIKKDDEMTN